MLPFEFIVDGPPISHQTRRASRLREWHGLIRAAVIKYLPVGLSPLSIKLSLTVVYYHDGVSTRIDNDNMVKPIQDALIGLIYEDDRQITDIHVRKTDLNGSFRVRGMSPMVAEGFCRGREFLYIRVDFPLDHQELP